MKLVYVVGNRPQFIKLAVLHRQMRQHALIRESVIHTGQHFSREMSDVFFQELAIQLPVTNLHVHSLSPVTLISRMMEALERELLRLAPDMVFVFGDTFSTLAGALTAKKMGIPVAHAEAGIRTFDENMPEESNRYLTDRIAALNFCCTQLGVENLRAEGIGTDRTPCKVVNSGDLMLDAYRIFQETFTQRSRVLSKLPVKKNEYVLFTLHRKQNIEQKEVLQQIIRAVTAVHKELPVVCPLHPNTKNILLGHGLFTDFFILPPVGYFDMQYLLQHCRYVITDSGGLQREAFFAQKPAVIIMDKPFWPEVIQYGCAVNCTADEKEILNGFKALQNKERKFETAVFGNGNAADVITQHLIQFYQTKLANSR